VSKTTMPDYGMLSSGLSSFTPGAQPLGPEQRPRRLQRRRRRRGRRRLRPAARGHRHRRLHAPAGQLVRHLRPQAQPGPHPIDPPYTGRAAGPMTRSVEDAALMMQVLASPTRATA
jgi:amidase/aspartyl-tRNA(Asn)/glutamyl-tRNA(Gln) amidotransferase subunit A